MSEHYAGRQIVGIDLHRRRWVLVRMTDTGEQLETIRISNDPEYLKAVMARAGEAPEVVLEGAYGWYWAADTLAELGATVHLAHPLGVKMFSYRRVKNDQRDAADLADLLRMGRLPEAWIAPPAKGVAGVGAAPGEAGRAALQLEVPGPRRARARGHLGADQRPVRCRRAAAAGRTVGGRPVIDRVSLPAGLRAAGHRRIGVRDRVVHQAGQRPVAHRPRLPRDQQAIPGVGRVLAAVFVAEIGDITRFHRPEQLASWAGLTPEHPSPTPPCTGAGSPNRVRGWCAGRRSRPSNVSAPIPAWATPGSGRCAARPQHRRRGRRPGTAHPGLLRAA